MCQARNLQQLVAFLDTKQNENCCILIDFNGCHLNEDRIAKKILYFLASDYRINQKVNAVIINPPDRNIVETVQLEILHSPQEKRNFIYHSLPCFFQKQNGVEIIWIGISKETQYLKLNEILYTDVHDNISLSDFNNDKKLVQESGFFSLDEHGNVILSIKNIDGLSIDILEERAIIKKENSVYLCAGNYYQESYFGLLEQLYDSKYSSFIATLLHKKLKLKNEISLSETTHLLAITLSSQFLTKSFISQIEDNKIREKMENNFVRLSNYHSFFLEADFIQKIKENDKVVVICDVISTGYLIKHLKQKLENKHASLIGIISVFDTRTENKADSVSMFFDSTIPCVSLKKIPVDKYKREEIKIENQSIIRINPATNTPITLNINKSEIEESVLFPNNDDFLGAIDIPADYIQIGYYKHNELFHSYFFNTNKLFKSSNGQTLLKKAFEKIEQTYPHITIDSIDFVFYPIFSSVERIDSDEYKNIVFKNKKIEFVPIGRFNTPNGWRYTFPPKMLNAKTQGKNVFIIDDGSCTGSTIIQMIDEISFLDVESINVLSIVGRIDDYLREFFSRIKKIKVRQLNDELTNSFAVSKKQDETDKTISLNIFFCSQWQIQTYSLGGNFPFHDEKMKLEHYRELEHVPKILSNYIDCRHKLLSLDNVNEKQQFKYLPSIPKVENT